MYGTLVGAGAVGIATGLLSRNRRHGIDTATSLFAHVASAVGDVRVEVIGAPNAWAHRPAVFMINHQSALIDLLVTTTVLRGGFTGVAKKEVASVPVFGQLLSLADFAFLDRSDRAQARAVLDEAAARLARGTSIVISPEGTRSLTPSVGRFKKGGFHLAMQAGVPIVPLVIRNAGELMWRNSKTARPGTVQVLVHEPIPTKDWTKQDLDAAVVEVQQLFQDTLENWPTS
jgi:putative phosphoserine phosphatase/1-acylglycerol-3-phosphate O-acyltransferase